MKMSGFMSIGMLTLLAFCRNAGAEPTDETDSKNPYAKADPDGVPLVVTQNSRHPPTPAQIDALRKQAVQDARNRNWLLLEYQDQLRNRSEKSSDKDKNSNMYLQLSLDKDMSKLPGLQSSAARQTSTPPPPLTGASQPGKDAPALRQESPSAAKNTFIPLISPLQSPGALTVQNFFTTLPSNLTSSNLATSYSGFSTPPNSAPAPAPTASHSSSFTEVTDLQTPGMVAARQNPSAETTAPDLSLDSLPGETPDQARAHQENYAKLELPSAMDSDQLHKQQASTLKIPTATNGTQTADKTTIPVAPKAILVNPEDAPVQVNQQAQIIPVHGAIANPYDILNR